MGETKCGDCDVLQWGTENPSALCEVCGLKADRARLTRERDEARRDAEMQRRVVADAQADVEKLDAEVERLREALDLCGSAIRCEHLHHGPSQRHDSGEPCPVEAKIAALRGEEGES